MVLLLVTSCNRDRLDVNVTKIDLEIEIHRLERDLFGSNTSAINETIEEVKEEYGDFLTLFNRVINIGEVGSPAYHEYLNIFLTDKINNEVYEETLEIFPQLDDLEKEITSAFKHYIFYFPGKEIPEVYSFVSRFNTSLIIGEGVLGIGLDRYLGSDCVYYAQLGLPQYARNKMHKGKIVSDCMYAWATTEWIFEGEKGASEPSGNVLNHMIYEGKLIYFVLAMMPGSKDDLIMGFSEDQMKWCRRNEKNMWTYLIEHKLLFDNNYMTINKLTKDGPFTSYFPAESPARAAVWMGLQIVRKYLERMPDVSLEELMAETDYQKILQLSQYDP